MPSSVLNTSHEPSPLNLTGFHQDQCGYDSHFTSEQTEASSRSVAESGLEPRLFTTLRNRAGAQWLVSPFFQSPQNAHSAPCPKALLVLQFTKVPKHLFTLIYYKLLYFGPFVLIQVAPLNFAETILDKLPCHRTVIRISQIFTHPLSAPGWSWASLPSWRHSGVSSGLLANLILCISSAQAPVSPQVLSIFGRGALFSKCRRPWVALRPQRRQVGPCRRCRLQSGSLLRSPLSTSWLCVLGQVSSLLIFL